MYFVQLQDDISKLLYNDAAQAQKAPGSAFKPIIAVVALEEGVTGLQGTVECISIYDQVSSPIKYWIYPGWHDGESAEEDI